MALVVKDRVQETSTTSGTGTLTLAGAVPGFQDFSTAIGNGNTTFYTIYDNVAQVWEVGVGTVGAGTLARTTVLSNSSGTTSPITLAGNAASVFCTYPAEQSVNLDASGNVSPLGTISSGTWQGSTVGVAYGGTGVTASSGPNSVVLRTANEDIAVNRISQKRTVTTASASTTALTDASAFVQTLVGTGVHTFSLPDATTLVTGTWFLFDNDSTGNLTVTDYAGATKDVLAPGGYTLFILEANSTVAGYWIRAGLLPSEVNWGTNSLDLGGSTVITNGTWQGNVVGTAYGGTGLNSFGSANYALYSTSSSVLTAGTLPSAAGGTSFSSYTTGDIIYASATDTLSKLGVGTNGYILTVSGGVPTWAAAPATGVTSFQTSLSGLTPSTSTTGAVTLAGTLGATSGGTSQSTYTTGDILYASATNTLSKLPAGTDGKVLTLASGVPSWATPGGSTTLTTDSFTATAGQTTFAVVYTPSLLQGVYRNGVKLAPADYTATSGTDIILNTGANLGDNIQIQYFSALSTTSQVTSISFGSTGLTPSTASTGAVTVAGTLAIGSGGTGQTTANAAFNALAPSQSTNTGKYLTTDGTNTSWASVDALPSQTGNNGKYLTTNGTVASWATVNAGASLSNDTTTASTLYPLFAAATTGTPTTIYTSNSNYLYQPSNGALRAKEIEASNGIMVNNATISSNYTIPTGYNASSVGPVTMASGIAVTVPSGSRWLVL
jgi:hypothetical protein